MAYASDIRRTNPFAGIKTLFADLRHAWTQYRMFHTTQEELSALSDRELTDLGISRSEITRIAREAAKSV
ncbi:MAG: hypothetical protein CR993_03165 [Rhodobacterales bacterium]|nr:MAG: hypothetical protein CR993_03165 [Rhodobacterales bacterium]